MSLLAPTLQAFFTDRLMTHVAAASGSQRNTGSVSRERSSSRR
jgi:hypothetical protein